MVTVGTGGIGTRFIRTEYPVEEGLEAGTQKQEGRTSNLVIQEGSTVLESDEVEF